jgi:hypothetical protein
MPTSLRCLAALCLATGIMSSCAWLYEEDEPPANPNAPKLVGRIASIPPDQRFVLIQSYGKWTVPAGTVLTAHGPDGRSANLIATGESLRHFAAADVQSGTFEIGDGVYTPPTPPKTESTETPAAESSEIPDKKTKVSSN